MLQSIRYLPRYFAPGIRTAPCRARSYPIPRPWRCKTTLAGDDKSGHLNTGPNEAIVFIDNVFPIKIHFFLGLSLFNADKFVPRLVTKLRDTRTRNESVTAFAKGALPSALPIEIKSILPSLKEGGAFVKFTHTGSEDVKEVETQIRQHLKENPIKPWFNPFIRVKAALVRGRPWVEDLYGYPSSRLKVEFLPTTPEGSAAELSQETLYTLFRRYGKLSAITAMPSESKVTPRYAMLNFFRVRHAIMAKNCLHGYILPSAEGGGASGTMIKLRYEQKIKAHWIRDWFFNHPRIVVPLLLLLATGISVTIFDPIRTFFIKAHVDKTFHLSDNKVYRWVKSQITRVGDSLSFVHHKKEEANLAAIWDDRKESIEQLQKWLIETADTFIVVQGPKGSGKMELVKEQALKDRKNTLIIDCKHIQEARGDGATIGAAAAEVGYKPVFSWMNSISSLVDLAAQGTIGTKTGFSETLDTQMVKIFQNTSTALKSIALQSRKKDDKDANLSEDEYLEAHPERRPVVVINNFLHKSQEGSIVYDKISEWAAGLTTSNTAHVIFLTTDVSFSKSLSKALPNRMFRHLSLGDCSPEAAKRFVISHLDADAADDSPNDFDEQSQNTAASKTAEDQERSPNAEHSRKPSALTMASHRASQSLSDGAVFEERSAPEKKPSNPSPQARLPSQTRQDLDQLDSCIATLGGRLTDLEFLARRIKTGESPSQAVKAIISQAASEILKMYILDVPSPSPSSSSTPPPTWTPSQAWLLVKLLASAPDHTLRYNALLLDPQFSSSEPTLQALEQAELITITSEPSNGRPREIKPGRPVFAAAFRQLVQDPVLKARMDLGLLGEMSKGEERKIEGWEGELKLLGDLPGGGGKGLRERVRWLVEKVRVGQRKVEGWEGEMARLKAVLGRES